MVLMSAVAPAPEEGSKPAMVKTTGGFSAMILASVDQALGGTIIIYVIGTSESRRALTPEQTRFSKKNPLQNLAVASATPPQHFQFKQFIEVSLVSH